MRAIYRFNSAAELNEDVIEGIKRTFKSKAFTIIIMADELEELTPEEKATLDQRLNEDEADYISAAESIESLKKSNG